MSILNPWTSCFSDRLQIQAVGKGHSQGAGSIFRAERCHYRSEERAKSKTSNDMENLIGLVNRLQQACTVLGDYGVASAGDALPTLWEQLPSVAVVGGQVCSIRQ